MIRINLLPIRKVRERESSRNFVVLILVVVVVQALIVLVVDRAVASQLDEKRQRNGFLRNDIDKIKREIADHDDIRRELDDIRARDEAIEKLKAARTGPTYMLLELARILSVRGPTIARDRLEQLRRDNPLAVYNERWDGRRLWLTQFAEESREVRLAGQARSNDDVAELLRRLNLSDYFFDVVLEKTEQHQDTESGLRVVRFDIKCNVRYQ